MQESILSVLNKKNRKKKETEEVAEKMTLLEDIQQLSIDKEIEQKVRRELDQVDDTKSDPKVEVPMCNYGPGCRCNPELPKDIFDQIEGIDDTKKEDEAPPPCSKRKKRRRLKTAFKFNVQVDFHDANSNFYQLLSSEDETDSVEDSLEIIEDAPVIENDDNAEEETGDIVREKNDEDENSDNSFISDKSLPKHRISAEIKTEFENPKEEKIDSTIELNEKSERVAREHSQNSETDEESLDSFIDINDDLVDENEINKDTESDSFVIIEQPSVSIVEDTMDDKTLSSNEDIPVETKQDIPDEDPSPAGLVVMENNFLSTNKNENNYDEPKPSTENLQIPVITEEDEELQAKDKVMRPRSAVRRRHPKDNKTTDTKKKNQVRPHSARITRTGNNAASNNESCNKLVRRNCKDIMGLLLQESSFDLNLNPDWGRRSATGFNLQGSDTASISSLSPLPPISSSPRPTYQEDLPRITSPTWTRPSSAVFPLDHDVASVGEQHQWLRSSTPANTLPSLRDHL